MSYDVKLGRLRLVTINGDINEAVGDSLEAIGAAIAAGERRARPFPLTLPVYGSRHEDDPFEATERIRRQVRALMENADVRLGGLYLAVDFDPDMNGWLLVGGGDLKYGPGGVAIGDHLLELTDCYKVGNQRTVRPARRLEVRDRRLATVARDYLGMIRSTNFAAETATVHHFLPVGASDPIGAAAAVLQPATRSTIDGALPLLTARPDGEVVTFLHSEANHGLADVVAFDRRGFTAPSTTLAGDKDPQSLYGWEELYGPDQPLTTADIPVLQNGLCRLRWVDSRSSFALDAFVAGTGYVEQGRVSIWRDTPAGTETQYTTVISRQLVEWTPERAVLHVRLGISTTDRVDLYITLQRGWTGPRVEAYASWASAGKPGVAIRLVPFTSGATTLGREAGTVAISNGTTHLSSFATWAPWLYLLAPAPNLALHAAVLAELVKLIGRASSAEYGSSRNGISITAQDATAIEGYISATLGVGARGSETADATLLGETNLYATQAIPELVS